MPHIDCYPASAELSGGGDGEATEHGNTARTQAEEKTRNGNLRTLSRHGELAEARAKRPELIWPKRVVGPVIVAGEIDVLPAE